MYKKICQRCGHTWEAKKPNPITCSRCKSRYWNTKKREKLYINPTTRKDQLLCTVQFPDSGRAGTKAYLEDRYKHDRELAKVRNILSSRGIRYYTKFAYRYTHFYRAI